jgi:plasmid stabilization system protein ParE
VKLIWSPLAIERMTEFADYIARDKQKAAEKWALGAFARVEQLTSVPNSGRIVPEVERQDIRVLIYGNYRIIYRVAADEVTILTVRHSRQLLELEELSSDSDSS